MEKERYQRILVVGPSGGGKSTFSRKLRDVLHLPLYHLDNLFWKNITEHISREEFDTRLAEWLNEDKWIIDGDYSRTYKMRMEKADTIIFLDYPLDLCLKSAEARVGTKRDDCPFVEKEFDPEFKQWIIDWYKDKRPGLLELLEEYKKTKEVIIFSSRSESDRFVQHLRS